MRIYAYIYDMYIYIYTFVQRSIPTDSIPDRKGQTLQLQHTDSSGSVMCLYLHKS